MNYIFYKASFTNTAASMSTQKISEQLNKLRKTVQFFPLKCKMYLSLLLSVEDQQFSSHIPKHVKKNYEAFTSIFKRLSAQERIYYLTKCVDYVSASMVNSKQEFHQKIQEIQTSCELKTTFMGVAYWEKRNFKYQHVHHRVKLSTSKKQELFELRHYLARRSQSQKNSIVLECISPEMFQKFQKLTIRFNNKSIYQQIYNNLIEAVIQISHKRLDYLLHEQKKQNIQQDDIGEEKLHRGLTILTRKNVTEYFNVKQKLIQKLQKSRVRVEPIYSNGQVKIYNSLQNKKFYYLQLNIPKKYNDLSKIKQGVNILNKGSIDSPYYCEKLQSFTQNIAANYYKLMIDRKEYQCVMISERIQKNHQFQQIMKAATNLFIGISIQFIILTIKLHNNKNQYSLGIQAIINNLTKNKNKNISQTIQLLLGLISHDQTKDSKSFIFNQTMTEERKSYQLDQIKRKSLHNIQQNQKNDNNNRGLTAAIRQNDNQKSRDSQQAGDQMFFTIINYDDFQEDKDLKEFMHTISPRKSKNCSIVNDSIKESLAETNLPESQNESNQNPNQYLKAKPFNQPLSQIPHNFISDHFLFVEWKKSVKGGVVCINQAAINQQKRIFKLILAQMGQNILKNKGIMNISLPVQIFKKQSSLISIARNLSYAPLLFELIQKQTVLQRMKRLIIFQISMAALALSSQKPFNPILGQTYQGQINGCPVFLQQICHHPPISYLYLVGRGYKIYGAIAPQVALRLNCAKGINQKYLTVQFDNGNRCELSLPTMVINGMMFGERTIFFQGTNFIIDYQNMLITQITYNVKRGFFNFKSKQSPDFLSGDVYLVTAGFMEKFIGSNKTLSPKKDQKNKVMASFCGEWNGSLYYNQQLIFNYQERFPLLLQNCENPLKSDSVYRTDVIELINKNLVRSQEEKDALEEIQRNDKKMRVKYQKQRLKNQSH